MIEKLKAWLDTLDILKCHLFEEVGLYCPGCGGTRAILSLLQGNIIQSIKYNPIIIYTILVILFYIILKVKKKLSTEIESKYILIAIVVGFLVVIIRTLILDYYVIVYRIHLI